MESVCRSCPPPSTLTSAARRAAPRSARHRASAPPSTACCPKERRRRRYRPIGIRGTEERWRRTTLTMTTPRRQRAGATAFPWWNLPSPVRVPRSQEPDAVPRIPLACKHRCSMEKGPRHRYFPGLWLVLRRDFSCGFMVLAGEDEALRDPRLPQQQVPLESANEKIDHLPVLSEFVPVI